MSGNSYRETLLLGFITIGVAGILGYIVYFDRMSLRNSSVSAIPITSDEMRPNLAMSEKIIVNEQAQKNLQIIAKPLKPTNYWRTISLPGIIVDRPGQSDRGVAAPAAGIITDICVTPGEIVEPGQKLFTLRAFGESLQLTQTELYKVTQEIILSKARLQRLRTSAGALPEARLIEVDHEISRLKTASKAYRRQLLNRGFSPALVDGVAEGTFIHEFPVYVPARLASTSSEGEISKSPNNGLAEIGNYEVQELKVELGRQVQAGETLCTLANHHVLSIRGFAFPDEITLVEKSVLENWPVAVDFQDNQTTTWPDLKQPLRINHLSNNIDPENRTFSFMLNLENESLTVSSGRRQTLWRFRPGQKVRLQVRIQQIDDVYVLPASAVTREGLEWFIFIQNVNTFSRQAVRLLHRDRQSVVIARDPTLPIGIFAVQSSAAELNRMLKAVSNGGTPKGYHIHADGSLHKNDDEGR